MVVSFTTVNVNTSVPPILTAVTPKKLVPDKEKAPELAQSVVLSIPEIVGAPVPQA